MRTQKKISPPLFAVAKLSRTDYLELAKTVGQPTLLYYSLTIPPTASTKFFDEKCNPTSENRPRGSESKSSLRQREHEAGIDNATSVLGECAKTAKTATLTSYGRTRT